MSTRLENLYLALDENNPLGSSNLRPLTVCVGLTQNPSRLPLSTEVKNVRIICGMCSARVRAHPMQVRREGVGCDEPRLDVACTSCSMDEDIGRKESGDLCRE